MDPIAQRIASKLYDYKPSAMEIARAEELEYMAEQITPSRSVGMSERDADWSDGREAAADMLRERARDIREGTV